MSTARIVSGEGRGARRLGSPTRRPTSGGAGVLGSVIATAPHGGAAGRSGRRAPARPGSRVPAGRAARCATTGWGPRAAPGRAAGRRARRGSLRSSALACSRPAVASSSDEIRPSAGELRTTYSTPRAPRSATTDGRRGGHQVAHVTGQAGVLVGQGEDLVLPHRRAVVAADAVGDALVDGPAETSTPCSWPSSELCFM